MATSCTCCRPRPHTENLGEKYRPTSWELSVRVCVCWTCWRLNFIIIFTPRDFLKSWYHDIFEIQQTSVGIYIRSHFIKHRKLSSADISISRTIKYTNLYIGFYANTFSYLLQFTIFHIIYILQHLFHFVRLY